MLAGRFALRLRPGLRGLLPTIPPLGDVTRNVSNHDSRKP